MTEHLGDQPTDTSAILAQMAASRGYTHPAHEFLAAESPEFLAVWNDFVGVALLHGDDSGAALPVKYRELIVACLLSLLRVPVESVAEHLKRAMRAGLTRQEALEAYQAACVPGGAPVLMHGARALMLIAQADADDAPPG